MAHRTQLYLNEDQYEFVKIEAKKDKKSMAELIRQWIDEKKARRKTKKFENDPFLKARGLFKSGHQDMALYFDEYLYGTKKE